MADVSLRSDDLLQLRTSFRHQHPQILDSVKEIPENCLPNILFRLSSEKLKLIHDGVPVGERITEPTQGQHEAFGGHRRLDRVGNLRQLQKLPVSGDEPSARARAHLEQGRGISCSILELDQVPLKINSGDLLRYPLLTPFQRVWQEHCKESSERCRPSSNCCDCIPPHHAIVDTQRAATKHSIKPCHSLIPLWIGRHSATGIRRREFRHV